MLAESRAPRYAYQTFNDYFYEMERYIRVIFERRAPINSQSLQRDNWEFGVAKALTSRLNLKIFKDVHREEYQRVEAEVVDNLEGESPSIPAELLARLQKRKKALLKTKTEEQ